MTLAVWRRLIIASLLVLLSALAYQASVHSSFQAVTVPIISNDTRPTGRVVRVALPDLSPLGPVLPIVTGRLANGSSQRQRTRVMFGDVVRAEVDMAPDGEGRFALTLSEGNVRAIADDTGRRYAIDLVGDNDEWRVISLHASSAFASIRSVAALVPSRVAPIPPARSVTWALLVVLGVLSLVFGGAANTGLLRWTHRVGAGIVTLVLFTVWLLPLTSDRRLLSTPLAFWSTVGVLFAPAIVGSARTALSRVAAVLASSVRCWRRHPITSERGAIFLALVAMAVAQPLFDVLRASPEFFVARNTTAVGAVTAVGLMVFGLPLLLLAIERVLRSVASRAATLFMFVAVATLLALMVHPWLRRSQVADPATMAVAAVAAGALLGWLAWRAETMRQFLAALAPAALIVPVAFFANPEVIGSFTRSSSDVRTPPLESTPPIVLVVFDEFPVHSLLDADDQIDAVRFPGFAALARDASWFRETTTVSSQTVWAVPAIVSGRYPVTPNAVPTLRYYPASLFTLLADRYRMHVFGRFLQLCPEEACERDAGGPSDGPISLLADFGVVWLHIVLPTPLTEYLPPVVGDWRGFARAARWRSVDGRMVRNDRRGEFDRFLAAIDGNAARLYFLHTLLPHMPFEYVPSERRYDAPDLQGREERGVELFQRVEPAYADAAHQRHLLQVGFVDALIGRLIARLRSLGIYDQALVIVTADHGASYREGVPRRTARTQNMADIIRVPLFIKRPGQTAGAIVDGLAESVDILPTIADLLGARLPFEVDGRSLIGASGPSRTTRTFIARSLTRINTRDVTNWRQSSEVSVSRRIRRFGVGTYDAVYAVPGTGELIGRPADAYSHREGTVRVRLASPEEFLEVDLESDTLPLHVRGRVYGRVTQPLAVVVNGSIAATTRPYLERGVSVFGTMIPEQSLRVGRNEIATFVVDQVGGATTLVTTQP